MRFPYHRAPARNDGHSYRDSLKRVPQICLQWSGRYSRSSIPVWCLHVFCYLLLHEWSIQKRKSLDTCLFNHSWGGFRSFEESSFQHKLIVGCPRRPCVVVLMPSSQRLHPTSYRSIMGISTTTLLLFPWWHKPIQFEGSQSTEKSRLGMVLRTCTGDQPRLFCQTKKTHCFSWIQPVVETSFLLLQMVAIK